MDSRFCSLTAWLKNEKYKRTKCNLCRNGKIKTKYKNTNCSVQEVMENTQIHKNTIVYSFVFSVFSQKIQKYKKYKIKYECSFSKIQNTNKYKPKKIKNKKYTKIRTQNFKNTKDKKYEFKKEPESQPHVHSEKHEPTRKINAKPTCCIF